MPDCSESYHPDPPITEIMVWFFERDGECIQCEIRPSPQAGFDLEVLTPDGGRELEHSDDANVLALRWMELENKLKRNGWRLKE